MGGPSRLTDDYVIDSLEAGDAERIVIEFAHQPGCEDGKTWASMTQLA